MYGLLLPLTYVVLAEHLLMLDLLFQYMSPTTQQVASITRVHPVPAKPTNPPPTELPFASLATITVNVQGCPATPATAAASNLAVSIQSVRSYSILSYAWQLLKTSSLVVDSLELKAGEERMINLTASATKSTYRWRQATLEGAVQLKSLGSAAVALSKVQAATLARTGQPVIVDAVCPPVTVSTAGTIIVAAGATVDCSFKIQHLPPMGKHATADLGF